MTVSLARGHIRRRGGSFQVLVYAGTDPLTGKPNYLTESTRDEGQAQKILTRLLAQVDEQRNPRTKATFGKALGRGCGRTRLRRPRSTTPRAVRGAGTSARRRAGRRCLPVLPPLAARDAR